MSPPLLGTRLDPRPGPHLGRLPRRGVGALLLSLGLVADVWAGGLVWSGTSLWQGPAVWGLLLHGPAVLIWMLGMSVLEGCPVPGAVRGTFLRRGRSQGDAPRETPPAPAWTLAAAALSLFLFPGLGTAGCSLAYALSALLPPARPRALRPGPAPGGAPGPALASPLDVEVQPLVDVLADRDAEMRRVSAEALARDGSPVAVRLLRGLLTDLDADVRNDAAVALSRLENSFNRALGQAFADASHYGDGLHYAALGRQCYRYAQSNLLDEVSRRSYLAQAGDALQQAVDLAPGRPEVWCDLAQAQLALGEVRAAWRSVGRAMLLAPRDRRPCLLGMEMAFLEHRWDRLVALAGAAHLAGEPGGGPPADDDATEEVIGWWRGAGLTSGGGVRGS
jgi:HEAT repeats